MDTLEFICKGINNKKGFLREHTGRGEDISPEFVINNLSRCENSYNHVGGCVPPDKKLHTLGDLEYSRRKCYSQSNPSREADFGQRLAGDRLWISLLCGSEASARQNPQVSLYDLCA